MKYDKLKDLVIAVKDDDTLSLEEQNDALNRIERTLVNMTDYLNDLSRANILYRELSDNFNSKEMTKEQVEKRVNEFNKHFENIMEGNLSKRIERVGESLEELKVLSEGHNIDLGLNNLDFQDNVEIMMEINQFHNDLLILGTYNHLLKQQNISLEEAENKAIQFLNKREEDLYLKPELGHKSYDQMEDMINIHKKSTILENIDRIINEEDGFSK